jgi:caffeoyl-CoA O-methyltransferase
VKVLVGNAQEIVKDLRGPFDFIFNDIDKAGYPAVLEPCIERVRVGGLLVTDNVLWRGEVARKDRSKETQAIRTYNERLAKDPRMIASIVPLRDGVSVALKVRT